MVRVRYLWSLLLRCLLLVHLHREFCCLFLLASRFWKADSEFVSFEETSNSSDESVQSTSSALPAIFVCSLEDLLLHFARLLARVVGAFLFFLPAFSVIPFSFYTSCSGPSSSSSEPESFKHFFLDSAISLSINPRSWALIIGLPPLWENYDLKTSAASIPEESIAWL